MIYKSQTNITEYTTLDCDSTSLVAHYKFDNPNSLNDEKGNYPLTNDGSNVIQPIQSIDDRSYS